MKILVIDDDALNRKILRTVMEDAGYEVLDAEDGQAGLDVLASDKDIGVILLDRMMPRMDGMEFMQEFAKHPEWVYKKVIMQTAANQPKDVISGKTSGVYYYLSKPFDGEIVLSIVRAAIDDIQKSKGLG